MTDSIKEYDCQSEGPSIKSLLYRSFGLFWDHKGLLVGAQLILLAILFGGDFLLRSVGGNVLLGPFMLGMYKICLAIARNKDTDISEILSGFEQFLPAFLANILIHLLAFIGFWLLIIPGLLVFLTYAATYFFILDDKVGFWDAMKSSRELTWGNKKFWLTLGVVILAINLAGLLCFVIGLVVTLPFSHLLITLAYEQEHNRNRPAEEQM